MSETHNPRWGSWDVGPTPIETYASNLMDLVKNGHLRVKSSSMEEHIYTVNSPVFQAEVTENGTIHYEGYSLVIKVEDVGSDEKEKVSILLIRDKDKAMSTNEFKDVYDASKFLKEFCEKGLYSPLSEIRVKLHEWGNTGRLEPQKGMLHMFSLVQPFQAWLESGDTIHVEFL